MEDLLINVPIEGLILTGFAIAWAAGALGATIRAFLKADKGGDPGI